MKNRKHDLDRLLRVDAVSPADQAERERLWNLVATRQNDATTRFGSREAPLPKRRRFTRVILVAAAVLIVGGGAIAAGANLVQRITKDDAPIDQQIDQFRTPTAEKVTAAEYKMLAGLPRKPETPGNGEYPDAVLKQFERLVPQGKATVVADDPRVGRLIAAPATDVSDLCYLWTSPKSAGLFTQEGSCQLAPLDASGVTVTTVGGPPTSDRSPRIIGLTGLAVDGVTQVQVKLENGQVADAALVDNVYLWTGKDSTDGHPVEIDVTRNGIHYKTAASFLARAYAE